MPDETTSNPAPVDTAIPQAPEAPISTAPEAVIVPTPAEAPTELIPTPEPIPEPPSVGINQLLGASGEASATRIEASPQSPISENINSHLGGNDPIEFEPAESNTPTSTIETTTETLVAVTDPVPAETLTQKPPEEITQQTPAEPVIEATPVAESADSHLGRKLKLLHRLHILRQLYQRPSKLPHQPPHK